MDDRTKAISMDNHAKAILFDDHIETIPIENHTKAITTLMNVHTKTIPMSTTIPKL